MTLRACGYRVELRRPGTFFCRNAQVHATRSLVAEQVCSTCTRIDSGAQRRAIPSGLFDLDDDWRWIRTADLVNEAHRLAGFLPAHVEMIVGVARSGLLPAAAIATQLHLPLLSVSIAQDVTDLGTGGRGREMAEPAAPKAVAIVDDSVYGGVAMRHASEVVRRRFPTAEIIRAAVFVRPEAAGTVDLIGRPVRAPHLFEWNLFNCHQARAAALDFDGVLCEEWSGDEELEPSRYAEHVAKARPLHLPRRDSIPLIVSARLERYRTTTLAWLARWRVAADRVVLGPWRNVSDRRASYSAAEHKGMEYRRSRCSLFIESCERQAEEIFDAARKPVLALSTGRVFRS